MPNTLQVADSSAVSQPTDSHRTARAAGRDWHDGIEILRGIAAVSVMLHHCIRLLPWDVSGTPLVVFGAGWFGVDLFFVVSGYVITASALRQMDSAHYARHFWFARLARILPLYYVTCIAFLLFVNSNALREYPTFQLLTHLFFIHSLFTTTAFSINDVTWSLGVEMQFYLIAFFVVPLAVRLRRKTLAAAYLFLLTGVLLYRLAAFQWLHDSGAPDTAMIQAMIQVPACIDSFALGSLVWLLGAPRPDRMRSAGLALIALALFVVIYLLYDANLENYWKSLLMMTLFRSLAAACAAIALLAAISSRARASVAWRPMLWLGKISYGIYLWHLIVLYLVQRNLPFGGTVAVCVIVMLTLALAGLSLRVIEQPCIRWARNARY